MGQQPDSGLVGAGPGVRRGQKISHTDFTDDRLADVLNVFSEDAFWQQLEAALTAHTIRVYHLPVDTVRLDATVGQVYHDPEKHPLFQVGRTKQDTFAVQFKMMLGALDPMGLPTAVDVVSGDRAGPGVRRGPLYVPIYKRIRQSLGRNGPGVRRDGRREDECDPNACFHTIWERLLPGAPFDGGASASNAFCLVESAGSRACVYQRYLFARRPARRSGSSARSGSGIGKGVLNDC